jgi:hypothetical protein
MMACSPLSLPLRVIGVGGLLLAGWVGPSVAQTQPLPLPEITSPADDSTGDALPPQEDVPLLDALPLPSTGATAKPIPPPPALAVPTGPQVVVLQGLDKVTARISLVEVPVGGSARFGSLLIAARACQKSPPEEPPEAAAFLEITETLTGATASSVFSGWMFASSPALSALEHPVYDVWVKDCKAVAPLAP